MKVIGVILLLIACICGLPSVDGELAGLQAGTAASNVGAYSVQKKVETPEVKPDVKPDDKKPHRPHIIFRNGEAGTMDCQNGTCKFIPTPDSISTPAAQSPCANGKCNTTYRSGFGFRLFRR